MLHNKSIGKVGEDSASHYLLNLGYKILHRNYSTKFGEIDIIAQKNGKVSFVEVKTRISLLKGQPYEAVTFRKIQHLQFAAQIYILKNKMKECKLSLDCVSIVLNNDLSVKSIRFFENIT